MSGSNNHLQADYVIVGGGSAGLVLANRLSEDGTATVILVEAGGEARGFMVQLPAGYAKLVGNPGKDWLYEQAPDPTTGGRQSAWHAGHLLGGGSAINGQVYIRGTRRDFDHWAEGGATGWGYDDVSRYFSKLEHWHGAPDQIHGQSGPLSIAPMQDFHPFSKSFLQACAEAGLPTVSGYGDGEMEGAFLTTASQRNGWRCSTEKAYLRPARRRANLTVLTSTEIETIQIKDERAVGVSVSQHGAPLHIDAKREVILSAGALGSAALLLRSGIGDGTYLKDTGIEVVHDLPGVGHNLQEHSSIRISKLVNRPTLNGEMGSPKMALYALRFAWNRKGPFGAPVVQAMALVKTREGLAEPDLQLHFVPFCVDPDPGASQLSKAWGITIASTLCHPESRGHVELGLRGRPRAVHRFLDDERDITTLTDGGRFVEQLFKSRFFAGVITGSRKPAKPLETREEWADYLRDNISGAHHHAGTCKMGTGDDAVVDLQLRVRGIDGLRVVDASVMPRITSVNTNATTIMIAEKAADMIRGIQA